MTSNGTNKLTVAASHLRGAHDGSLELQTSVSYIRPGTCETTHPATWETRRVLLWGVGNKI